MVGMSLFNELHTIRDFLRYAISCFEANNLYYGHGTDNAKDEAYYLIWHALNLPHYLSKDVLNARLLKQEKVRVCQLINKRINTRMPAAYLTNKIWFANLEFYVDQRVLIPRSALAEVINEQFQPWLALNKISNILEIGTGSACIAIACATTLPNVTVDATDIAATALEVAKINVLRHQLGKRVNLYQADLFPDTQKKYDIIISNPPYVSIAEMPQLPPEYHHEPTVALVAGDDGLAYVKQILLRASSYLSNQGILVMEVGNSKAALVALFPELPFIWLDYAAGDLGIFIIAAQHLPQATTT
jgi:ribosomal protein L3 glutamine methyltransferase